MVPAPDGKSARKHWRAITSQGGRTHVEFRPETGRTHQIRAHARYGLDSPVVGDPIYGTAAEGMLLHALRLVVPREKKAAIDVSAPLPERFGDWGDGF
jgi:tRNA pseudouridine32 synthase/23S rRNA pseudouridine746 synthase